MEGKGIAGFRLVLCRNLNKSKDTWLGSGRRNLPEKIEVLKGFSRVGGLKLAGIKHQKANKIQAPDARRVTRLMAH